MKAGFLAGAVCGWRDPGPRGLDLALPEGWFALRISDYKALPGALRVLGAKVLSERSGPLELSFGRREPKRSLSLCARIEPERADDAA